MLNVNVCWDVVSYFPNKCITYALQKYFVSFQLHVFVCILLYIVICYLKKNFSFTITKLLNISLYDSAYILTLFYRIFLFLLCRSYYKYKKFFLNITWSIIVSAYLQRTPTSGDSISNNLLTKQFTIMNYILIDIHFMSYVYLKLIQTNAKQQGYV